MAKTVHIFYNGEGVHFPPRNDWEKFSNENSARVFAICAESWRRNGWEVKRLSTTLPNDPFPRTQFLPDGECQKSFHWYPREYWQFIAKAKKIAVNSHDPYHVFITFDVINFGFTPCVLLEEMVEDKGCVSFQSEHFSMSAFACTYTWLFMAEDILGQYDRGMITSLGREYVSDETILRKYSNHSLLPSSQIMASNTESPKFPLLHFARTTLKPCFDNVSLS